MVALSKLFVTCFLQDFAALQLDEIQASIDARKNSIFLHMEEAHIHCCDAFSPSTQVRRLRIQLRLKAGAGMAEDVSKQEFESALPLLPPLARKPSCLCYGLTRPQTERSIKDYYVAFTVIVLSLIAFGGYFAPMAEVKLGLGFDSVALQPSKRCSPSNSGAPRMLSLWPPLDFRSS